jgi:hypothetical protein
VAVAGEHNHRHAYHTPPTVCAFQRNCMVVDSEPSLTYRCFII